MANPRITITVREDQYEQIEARRRVRNLSQSRMIEYLIEHGLEALDMADLEQRSPVVARLDELTEVVEELGEELRERIRAATEERIVPRVVDGAIRSQMVYEMMARISQPAAQLDREQLRGEAARALKRGSAGREVEEART